MNEFNFRVANAAPRASGFEIGQNVGDTKTTYIYSYKTKYINGKSTGQKTNVDWYMESSIPSWVSVKYAFEGNDCKVTFTTLQENTGSSARTHTLVFKQRESGQTISFPISQEPNFTYTYSLHVLNVSTTIGANIGNTATIMVQSYMTRSDGEVMAKQPSVGTTPSWANKVTVKDGSLIAGAPNWYQIIVEATAANSGSSERSEILLVTCGDQRTEVTIWQKAQYITLTIHWPRNTFSGAFFKEGETPQTGSTGTAYRNFSVSDDTSVHKYKKSEGVRVNLRDGSTEIAYPGDRISAYSFTNQTWQLRSTFRLPSSDQSITL
nr:MAG: Putative binding domain, N-terminal [Bacteriophage sp.]